MESSCSWNRPHIENQDNEDNEKEQEFLAFRLSTEAINEEKVAEILPDSLGEGPETSGHHYDLTDIHEPFCTATALSHAHEVRSSLDAAQNVQDCKDESPLLKISRKYFVIIQDHAKKMTQLHEQLGKGRDASLSLEHHLEFLLIHDDPEDYQGQGYIQQLAQGCKMASNLVLVLSEGI
ncbi:putative neuroblastoma breakpoint family member 5 isoform X2 [Cavia porcellus]|uniref:putative neuroblastoma breakpoint family member 5 isoform X2 n=1 Tax=Cavia porcellus TaxID=10141 RepID=UPI002FE274CD